MIFKKNRNIQSQQNIFLNMSPPCGYFDEKIQAIFDQYDKYLNPCVLHIINDLTNNTKY